MGVGIAIKSFSPAECRAAARLAARGAGFSWGLADDIGYSAAWLTVRGLQFCAASLSRARRDFCAPEENAIVRGELIPSAPGKMLCPFVAGALICDLAKTRSRWKLSRVARPLMLVPFVAFSARATNSRLKIQWRGAVFVADGDRFAVFRNTENAAESADVRIAPCLLPRDFAASEMSVAAECKISAKEWKMLQNLAARTFVPASADSRRRAGAEENDDG